MRYILMGLLLQLAWPCRAQTHGLDFYIQKARENSPLLKEYQNQVQSLQFDSLLLKASLGPQVNILSNDSYAPIVRGWGYDEAITNIANVSGLVQASRNFLYRGNITAQYRNIALQKRALVDSMLLSQQDLVRTISDQYITAYGDLLAMDYNRDVFELMRSEEQALKKLTQKAVYKQTDYLAFYVTMQQQELTYLQSQITYNTDFLTLNYLAGLTDTSIDRVERPVIDFSQEPDFYHAVFYNRFETDSLRLANERELLRYEYKPKLGAYTDAGFNSSMQYRPYKNFGFSAGVSLTVPIYDGRQKQMKLSKLDIQERTRQNNRQFYENQYLMQLQLLKQQLRASELLVGKINQQIEYAHTLVLANGKLLQMGDISMKDYVLAINNYLAAKNLLTQNDVSRLKIQSQLNYWNIKK